MSATGIFPSGVRPRGIFVAWTRYIRRPESMQLFFGYELFFLPAVPEGLLRKLLAYLANSMKTVLLILRHRPSVLWIQLVPVFPDGLVIMFGTEDPILRVVCYV